MLTRLLRRVVFAFRRRDDLADELEFHRQMKADALRRDGVVEGDVAARTQRELGNDLLARERARDVWIPLWLQDITQDVKFGIRMLARDRRFTIAAVVALGLGIGVNNSVFTIVNAAMFKDVPFAEPERLVSPRLIDSRGAGVVTVTEFEAWRAAASSFEGLAASSGSTVNISEDDRGAERLRGAYMSANTARLLRVVPVAGRDFTSADEEPGAPAVLLISDEVWQTRYGGQPVVGRAVRINGAAATIVGVMPPRFAFPALAQVWQPLTPASADGRDRRPVSVFGRLKNGVGLATAEAEMRSIATRLAADRADQQKLTFVMTTLRDARVERQNAAIFATLLGAVGVVLLIACANVASLLLARSAHRAREVAIRASLGASRWRLIRQVLIECTLIAILAGAFGFWLSIFGAGQMSRAFGVYEAGSPNGAVMPYWVDLSADTLTMMFMGGACLIASLGIGLVPAWHLSRTSPNDTLKDGGRGTSTTRARRMTGGLIVAQLALTVILLSAAGQMVRGYLVMYYTDLVIDPAGVVAGRIVIPQRSYPAAADVRRFLDRLDERLANHPALSAGVIASDIPFLPLGFQLSGLSLRGEEPAPGTQLPQVHAVAVGPRFFESLALPLIEGRALAAGDTLPGQQSAVVNERFAGKYFPAGGVLGQQIRFTAQNGSAGPWLTVVGVARTLPSFLVEDETGPVAYVPLAVDPRPLRAISLLVRGVDRRGGIEPVVTAMREQVAALDRDMPVFAVQTLGNAIIASRTPARMIGSWFITIAIIALVLAALGLHALTAHGVAQRVQEIGIRIALGARPAQVTWLFVRRSMVHLALGLTLGVAGAVATGRLVQAILRGSDPQDPLTIAVVCALFVIVSMTASVLPSRRATRINAVESLRAD